MVQFERNRRGAALLARVVLVCSLFAIGLAAPARANDYQYTITVDPLNLSGLSMSVMFDATSLPGSTGLNVDPSTVQILNSPYASPYVEDVSILPENNDTIEMSIDTQTCPGGCDGIPNYLTRSDTAFIELLKPITGPGIYQFGQEEYPYTERCKSSWSVAEKSV